jgi:two-component system response regulator AtoC
VPETVLLVDDEPNILKVLTVVLERAGYDARTAESGEAALEKLRTDSPDVLVTDLKMPGIDGLELLGRSRADDPARPVILMTAHGTIETAVEAMKGGAFDYITKPINNNALLDALDKALNTRASREADGSADEGPASPEDPGSIYVGRSAAAAALLESVRRATRVDSTVLLVGETGVGKEIIARMLHDNGPRSSGPFQAVNSAALPANLIESELFGHEKGAFTGAEASKPGRFELADGGTLFLDEIGEMPRELQPKLLRVLQEQEFERVGGVKTRSTDVRVVAATNRDLAVMAGEGEFREDLYYRLSVVVLRLPPLRERREDIPLLAEHCLRRLATRFKVAPPPLSSEAAEALMRHDWPGNVRELQNLIERLMVLEGDGAIQAEAVSRQLEMSVRPLPVSESIKDQVGATSGAVEVQMIRKALEANNGNRTHAAAQLGISRRTLQLKMKRYGLQDRAPAGGGQ